LAVCFFCFLFLLIKITLPFRKKNADFISTKAQQTPLGEGWPSTAAMWDASSAVVARSGVVVLLAACAGGTLAAQAAVAGPPPPYQHPN
jgi:hypothetical protein